MVNQRKNIVSTERTHEPDSAKVPATFLLVSRAKYKNQLCKALGPPDPSASDRGHFNLNFRLILKVAVPYLILGKKYIFHPLSIVKE